MRRRFTQKNSFSDYLIVEALKEGLSYSFSSDSFYSIDEGQTWTKLPAYEYSESVGEGGRIFVTANAKVRGENGIGTFEFTGMCAISGDLFGLVHKSYNRNLVDYMFLNLFQNCHNLREVSADLLPATTLANNCYSSMFYGCISMVNAPELPATTLTYRCYEGMFRECASLINAPELPATTLATHCYANMFEDCTSLVNAPALPATTLADRCYSFMFCKCASLVNAPELPATTLTYRCYEGMFRECTSLVTAPELPAITLTGWCYSNMFYGCGKLNYIKAMFTTISGNDPISHWVMKVASSGTFIKNKNATWDITGTSGIPSGWTIIKE